MTPADPITPSNRATGQGPAEGFRPVRLDKWLWAVRLFKTRPLATAACRGGHVQIDGHEAKPSREVRPGQVIAARLGQLRKTVRVLKLTANRVSPQQSALFVQDLTPAEEYERAKLIHEAPMVKVPHGLGRPTKKQRRAIEGVMLGLSEISPQREN